MRRDAWRTNKIRYHVYIYTDYILDDIWAMVYSDLKTDVYSVGIWNYVYIDEDWNRTE